MKVFYDLHIHSALSPCADNDMTPNNIVNMAKLIDLDLLAVTDHNSTDNIPAIAHLANRADILLLPGIEMTTAEEVHMLAFFLDVDSAVAFGDMIYESLPDVPNNPDYFGQQHVLDVNDQIICEKSKLLISATPFDIIESCTLIAEYGGVCVPAHVNKERDSILANLGFFPPDIFFPTIEVVKKALPVDTDGRRVLNNSDAHTLGQIAEKDNYILLNDLSRQKVLCLFSQTK